MLIERVEKACCRQKSGKWRKKEENGEGQEWIERRTERRERWSGRQCRKKERRDGEMKVEREQLQDGVKDGEGERRRIGHRWEKRSDMDKDTERRMRTESKARVRAKLLDFLMETLFS